MSEHKTTTELIAEIDYEIDRLDKETIRLVEQIKKNKVTVETNNNLVDKLYERRKSILNYLNTDSNEHINNSE